MSADFRLRLIQIMGLLSVLLLQVYSSYWQRLFRERIVLLAFDVSTLTIGIAEIALDVVSGVLLTWVLFSGSVQTPSRRLSSSVLSLSVLVPSLALTTRAFLALQGFGLFPMTLEVILNWILYSPVPSIWLGVTIFALVQRLRS